MTEEKSEFEASLERGALDVPFFAKRFLDITLHPGQVEMVEAYIQRDNTGWRSAFLDICVSAGNRAGKTLALAIIIIHSCIYKTGAKPPIPNRDGDVDEQAERRWGINPYMWFHFAIAQEVADLAFFEIDNIFKGVHVAQKSGHCPLAEEVPGVVQCGTKYQGEYRWVVFSREFGGAEVHFRTTGEKALGSLGRDMHGVSFDEAGIETRLEWIIKNVLHLRRLGTGGQLFLISTPEAGLTEFADRWFMGDPEQPDRSPRKFSMRMSSRDNIGFGLDQEMFDILTADMDEDHIKQNIDGYFIQGVQSFFDHNSVDNAFVDEWYPGTPAPQVTAAKRGRHYIQAVDPAIKNDALWSLVFDASEKVARGVKADVLSGRKTTDSIVELTETNHFAYNQVNLGARCATAVDGSAMGGIMFKEALDKDIPGGVRSVNFAGPGKKRKLMGDLRVALDQGLIKMPRSGKWLIVRRQLLGYKEEDRHIVQDAVATLAVFVYEFRRTPTGGGSKTTPFNNMLAEGAIADSTVNTYTGRKKVDPRPPVHLVWINADGSPAEAPGDS